MSEVTIEVRENGPYKVMGPILLVDHNGVAIEAPVDRAMFLCRCGKSSDKPFCDGTHKREGWCATAIDGPLEQS